MSCRHKVDFSKIEGTFDPFAVAAVVFEALDTPISLGCYLRLKHQQYDALAQMQVDVANYPEYWEPSDTLHRQAWVKTGRPADSAARQRYFDDVTAVSFLRKYDGLPTTYDKGLSALDTFKAGEEACRLTNRIFKLRAAGRFHLLPAVEAVIHTARRKIARVLRDLDVNDWLEACRFGPGVAIGALGTSDYSKLSSNPSVTEELEPYALALLAEYPGWVDACTGHLTGEFSMNVYPGGKYAQVPKDAKTNRNIETQPLLNGWLQLGLGTLIRRRLRAVGVDLDNQEVNRQLSREGSIRNTLATLDLSNASDSIATELVRELLPPDWLFAMEITRTARINLNGQYQPLERFCSMGNGFTFDLESLIFWALSDASCIYTGLKNYRVSVFGDDIIVPNAAVDLLILALNGCGFTVNTSKSFYNEGPFRESCGADWWRGTNVRPFFLKEKPTHVASLISLANGLRRLAFRHGHGIHCDRRFAGAWALVLRGIPTATRRSLAFGYTEDDGYILASEGRDGFRVIAKPRRREPEHWFPAVGCALFRAWRRSRLTFPAQLRPEAARALLKYDPLSLIADLSVDDSGSAGRLNFVERIDRVEYRGAPCSPEGLQDLAFS